MNSNQSDIIPELTTESSTKVDYLAIQEEIKKTFAQCKGNVDIYNRKCSQHLKYEVESDGSSQGYLVYTNEYIIYFTNHPKKGPIEFRIHTREFRFGTQNRMPSLETFVQNRANYI